MTSERFFQLCKGPHLLHCNVRPALKKRALDGRRQYRLPHVARAFHSVGFLVLSLLKKVRSAGIAARSRILVLEPTNT